MARAWAGEPRRVAGPRRPFGCGEPLEGSNLAAYRNRRGRFAGMEPRLAAIPLREAAFHGGGSPAGLACRSWPSDPGPLGRGINPGGGRWLAQTDTLEA